MELNFHWSVDLKSPPEKLWQYLADTGSLSQAAGLPEWKLISGPCFAVNENERLDYFGTTVNIAARIQKESRGGDVVVSGDVLGDVEVGRYLETVPHTRETDEVEVRGLSGRRQVHRLVARADAKATV